MIGVNRDAFDVDERTEKQRREDEWLALADKIDALSRLPYSRLNSPQRRGLDYARASLNEANAHFIPEGLYVSREWFICPAYARVWEVGSNVAWTEGDGRRGRPPKSRTRRTDCSKWHSSWEFVPDELAGLVRDDLLHVPPSNYREIAWRCAREAHSAESPFVPPWREHDLSQPASDIFAFLEPWHEVEVVPWMPPPRPTFVYLIRCPSTGLTKIGKSDDVEARMRNLQCGSAAKLELLGSIEGPTTLERDLHRQFKSKREHHEWFRLTDGDIASVLAVGMSEAA